MKTQIQFTEKEQNIIKQLIAGDFVESCNGLYRCGETHLSKLSVNKLLSLGIMKKKEFIGKYGVRFHLNPNIHIPLSPTSSTQS